MKAKEIMTSGVCFCTPDQPLQEVAELMCEEDCGVIPVMENGDTLLGVITDRDIVCRGVAHGADPRKSSVEDFMTEEPITVSPDTPLEECCFLMEEKQIRRLPVVNDGGSCIGMVSLGDIALQASAKGAGLVVREVSRPAALS